jgi:hypothetical protein
MTEAVKYVGLESSADDRQSIDLQRDAPIASTG